jgi:hypothetical protein
VANEFIFAGAVKDNAPYVTQKGRPDKRLIRTYQDNFTIDSGKEVVLLDAKERGDLYEIRVVTDNPYAEVFIEMDEWRNDNASAAELLAEPDTGRLLSNFHAIDGGHPAVGYTLLYNPDIPEDYDGRIRVVLRNRIKPSKHVFGSITNYKSNGGLASPLDISFGGGLVISSGALVGAGMHTNPNKLGFMMAHNPEIDFNLNPGLGNDAFRSAEGMGLKRGALHPYVGIAGRPILVGDDLGNVGHSSRMLHIYVDDITDSTSKRPTWSSSSTQDIYVADFNNSTPLTTTLAADDRMYIHDSERVYFPGKITAVSTNQSLPTKFAKTGSSAYTGCLKFTVQPGLKLAPPAIRAQADASTFIMGGADASYGSVTTPADTNPQIKVYRAEIKRLKRISYDG